MKTRFEAAVSTLCALAMSVVLASCSLFAGEEGAVRDAVDTTMGLFKSIEDSDAADFVDQSVIESLNAYGIDANEFLGHCFKHLAWEIGDVDVSGDTGTVALSVTNVDLGAALDRAGEQFEEFASTDEAQELFDTEGEGALVKKLFSFFYELVDSGELETTTTDVTLEVFKNEDGAWEIDPDNNEFYSALYGGAEFSI